MIATAAAAAAAAAVFVAAFLIQFSNIQRKSAIAIEVKKKD